LRQVWEQRLTRDAGGIALRPRDELVPGAALISTPHDPEVRGSVHGDHVWEGYGLHWTETCEPDRPHLITDVAVVPATTPDVTQVDGIHARLTLRNLLPAEHTPGRCGLHRRPCPGGEFGPRRAPRGPAE
jgi:hypothetical protein